MRKLNKFSRPFAIVMIGLFMSFISVQNSPAIGTYSISKLPKHPNSMAEMKANGEPVAVAAAMAVAAVSVMAAGVAFALGIMDGVSNGEASLTPTHELEHKLYASNDFSQYDI